ncbi:MAG: AmmeMemoRadiSam system radical SAM enzyme, partial [Candidatus Eisenbacteria sp.]|nr:AmmeMemoRadiSam system radical SAM enzyme [Candidatus Eisenbacteria bacterium]
MTLEFAEARWWHRDRDKVVCELCPRGCRLREGQIGFCKVRRHTGGRLLSLTYGHPTSLAVDP